MTRLLGGDRPSSLLAMVILALGTASFGIFAGSADLVRRDYHAQVLAAARPQVVVTGAGPLSDAALRAVAAIPGVMEVEPHAMVTLEARTRTGAWVPFELTAVEDLRTWSLGRSVVEDGTDRPGTGELLVDVSATATLGVQLGAWLDLRRGDGSVVRARVAGLSRQPGRAAWFDGPAFGATSLAAARSLGVVRGANQLALRTADPDWPRGFPGADPLLREIVATLSTHGVEPGPVEAVARPGDTSLDRTLDGIDAVLLAVGALGLVAAALLVAGTVHGLLRRRRRELGVIQALGARPAQLFAGFGIAVARRLVPGVVLGLGMGLAGANLLSRFVAELINVRPERVIPSPSVIGAGVLVPALVAGVAAAIVTWLAVSLPPLVNLADLGVGGTRRAPLAVRLLERATPSAVLRVGVRGALRQGLPAVLVTASMALGGALFLAVVSVGAAVAAIPGAEAADVTGYEILATLMGAVGLAVVGTGALGLFANLLGAAAARRRELAVMTALGASPAHVATIVAGEALGVAALAWLGAVVLWPLIALPLGSELGTTLTDVGVTPALGPEPLLLLGAFAVAALAASAPAAWRAVRQPPAAALAYE